MKIMDTQTATNAHHQQQSDRQHAMKIFDFERIMTPFELIKEKEKSIVQCKACRAARILKRRAVRLKVTKNKVSLDELNVQPTDNKTVPTSSSSGIKATIASIEKKKRRRSGPKPKYVPDVNRLLRSYESNNNHDKTATLTEAEKEMIILKWQKDQRKMRNRVHAARAEEQRKIREQQLLNEINMYKENYTLIQNQIRTIARNDILTHQLREKVPV